MVFYLGGLFIGFLFDAAEEFWRRIGVFRREICVEISYFCVIYGIVLGHSKIRAGFFSDPQIFFITLALLLCFWASFSPLYPKCL